MSWQTGRTLESPSARVADAPSSSRRRMSVTSAEPQRARRWPRESSPRCARPSRQSTSRTQRRSALLWSSSQCSTERWWPSARPPWRLARFLSLKRTQGIRPRQPLGHHSDLPLLTFACPRALRSRGSSGSRVGYSGTDTSLRPAHSLLVCDDDSRSLYTLHLWLDVRLGLSLGRSGRTGSRCCRRGCRLVPHPSRLAPRRRGGLFRLFRLKYL
jgi:hypothetical protein